MTKILLVEDDKSLREIYGVRLLAEGYDIISAGDGEEALAMAIKDRPALIVSDVMMPKISGFDMLDILRSTTETRDIKVIMMTALSSEDQRKRGEDLGADRYLVKSQVGIEDVVRTVHEVLGDSAASTSPAAVQPPAAPSTPTQPPARDTSVAVPPRDDATSTSPAPQATTQQQPPQATAAPVPSLGQSSQLAPGVSPLPQPTAPFSTKRPAGLGDRIIQPLETTEDPFATSISDQMTQELGTNTVLASQPSTPNQVPPAQNLSPPQPAPEAAPAPQQEPTLPQPQLDTSDSSANQTVTTEQSPQPQFDAVSNDEASITSHLEFEETPQSDGESSSSAPAQSETAQPSDQNKPVA